MGIWTLVGFPAGCFLAMSSYLVRRTSRVEVSGPGASYAGPAIYVNWHRHLPFLITHHGLFRRWMMVSPAPYMAAIAIWCRMAGLRLSRGATGSGGRHALRELEKVLVQGGSVVLAVDGPAGPVFSVKQGCIDLARATGAPIIPVGYSCTRGRTRQRRWDKMLLPRCFDKIQVRYGSTIFVGALPADGVVEMRRQIAEKLNDLDPGLPLRGEGRSLER